MSLQCLLLTSLNVIGRCMDDKARDALIERLEQDVEDFFYFPHQGFIPHWAVKYWRLHAAVAEYLGVPTWLPDEESIRKMN